MFTRFVLSLRDAGVPASITEYLTLLGAMQAGVADYSVEDFYFLARATLVKDERHLDRFDRVFATCFDGLDSTAEPSPGGLHAEIPAEWLRRLAEKLLTEEERAQIEAIGGFDKLMETLRQRLAEQAGRHQGGSKWIGTAGTSPFGAYGYNPEGVRIGQDGSRHRRAVKVWDERAFRDLDDTVELGTRNLKLALRRLRRFARTGAWTCPAPSAPPPIMPARWTSRCRQERAQHGQGAAVPRYRRLDGRPCPRLGGAVLGRAQRVQAPRLLLLPQLPV
ncbi:MAG: hypothetical protein WDN49_15890 [Acetobacteraceae bacterium]